MKNVFAILIGLILAFFTLSGEVKAQQNLNSRIDLKTDSVGIPVVAHKDTLFYINVGYGAIGPKQRAQSIGLIIEDVSNVFNPNTDSINLVHSGDFYAVKFNDRVIVQITQLDADFKNQTATALAKNWKQIIAASVDQSLSSSERAFQYLLSLGIILLVLLVINFILKLLIQRLSQYILSKKDRYLKGIKLKNFEILNQTEEIELVKKALFVLRIILMIFIAYISFPIIFSLFPATKSIALQLFGYVLTPVKSFGLAILNYIPNLITLVVVIYIVRIILRYLKIAAYRIESGRMKISGFYPDWSKTTYELIRILIIALTFVMLFPYLPGAQSDVFKGVSVFIGVIFSLGSTSIIGNLVAGLVLTYMRPFKIGDRIKIGEIEGEIVEKTAFVIRVKTPKNEYITIPNSNVQSSHITNYNRSITEGGVILFTEITIGYDVPWRKVHELLLQAAADTPGLEKKPEPFVLQKALDDYTVRYQINAYSKKPLRKDLTYSLLHQNIQDIFNEADVEILSPTYISTRDGSASTVVKTKHKKSHEDHDLEQGEEG